MSLERAASTASRSRSHSSASNLAQLAIGVLGVLVITGEYSTGMIRASLGAVPKRLPVLWAKIVVFAAHDFVLDGPGGARRVLREPGDPRAATTSSRSRSRIRASPRTVIGGALYLTVVGVFALGLGAITRNTAGGIAVFAGVFFVIPPLMNILPTSWNQAISKYLPSSAGADVFTLTHGPHDLARPGSPSSPLHGDRDRGARCCSSAATPERQPLAASIASREGT